MRHLTSLFDLSTDHVREILTLARELKSRLRRGERPQLLAGHVLTQVFEKPSLRTRLSFDAAIMQLGGSSIFLSGKDAGFEGREAVSDVARVIGGYSDIIALRTYKQSLVEDFARWSGKPVINGLSNDCHPCQALADAQTIEEAFGSFSGLRVAYIGDGNNVAVSLAEVCGHLGMSFSMGTPPEYEFPRPFVERLKQRFPPAGTAGDERPASGGEACRCGLHRCVGQHGAGGREGSPPEGLRGVPGGCRTDEVRAPQGPLHALPARPPRPGSDRRGHGRPAEPVLPTS